MYAIFFTFFFSLSAFAAAAPWELGPRGLTLEGLLARGRGQPALPAALLAVSEELLATPYSRGNAGEGELDVYDQDPLWRLDVQDCTTYLETVMAAALAHDRAAYLSLLAAIRYEGGRVAYASRNHFPETDWVSHNESAGFVGDITGALFPGLVKTVAVEIDKPLWYRRKTANDIYPRTRRLAERERLAAILRDSAHRYQPESARLSYLPVAAFFRGPRRDPNAAVLNKIPSGSLFNVVHEGWSAHGFSQAISHQGIVVQKPEGTFMRHASPGRGVVDERLDLYFRRHLAEASLRGIQILEVRDPR